MEIITFLSTSLGGLKRKCQIGDGIGGTEKKLDGSYTIQECFDAVRLYHPNANGITRSEPCPNKCKCYAEFGMTGWNSEKKWQSCMLSKGCKYVHKAQIPFKIFVEFNKRKKNKDLL